MCRYISRIPGLSLAGTHCPDFLGSRPLPLRIRSNNCPHTLPHGEVHAAWGAEGPREKSSDDWQEDAFPILVSLPSLQYLLLASLPLQSKLGRTWLEENNSPLFSSSSKSCIGVFTSPVKARLIKLNEESNRDMQKNCGWKDLEKRCCFFFYLLFNILNTLYWPFPSLGFPKYTWTLHCGLSYLTCYYVFAMICILSKF